MRDESFGSRLKKARKMQKLTQVELANKLGVANTSICGWESDKSRPDESLVLKLCDILSLTPAYLMGYSPEAMSPEETEIMRKIRMLDPIGRQAVENLIDLEYSRVETVEEIKADPYVFLPLYTIGVSAGTGQFLDSDNYEMIAYPNPPTGADFALRVAGDSMEPEFHHNDTVFVKSQPELRNGQIGIFIFNGEAFIKVMDKKNHALISLNDHYSPIVITAADDVRIVGRVLGKA